MILFFLRHNNDVDNIVPVIYRLARDGVAVKVLCLNPSYDIGGDFRLRYLGEQCHVEVDHAYRHYATGVSQRAATFLVCTPRRNDGVLRRLVPAKVRSLFAARLNLARRFDVEWAMGLLEQCEASLIVFDWVRPGKFTVSSLLAAARRRGTPTVALPHGLNLVTSELRTSRALNLGTIADYGEHFQFDDVVAPEPGQGEYFVRGGLPREKLSVLGSARYCDEWADVIDRIAPRAPLGEEPDGRLKVVFFDKRFGCRREETIEMLHAIAQLDFVRLVVQPHTRKGEESLRDLKGVEMVSEIPPASLCRWADVVMGIQSSVLLGPLGRRQTVVYPVHLQYVSTLYEESGAGWMVQSHVELVEALRTIHGNREFRAYDQQAVDQLLERVVYAGDRGRDVLGEYSRFLVSRAERGQRGGAVSAPLATTEV